MVVRSNGTGKRRCGAWKAVSGCGVLEQRMKYSRWWSVIGHIGVIPKPDGGDVVAVGKRIRPSLRCTMLHRRAMQETSCTETWINDAAERG